MVFPTVALIVIVQIIESLVKDKLINLTKTVIIEEILDKLFKEKPKEKFKREERDKQFTQQSSFVGKVEYFPGNQGMTINLNGTTYDFCSVPERVFDGFEGASSKGAFFNRAIKGQFNC